MRRIAIFFIIFFCYSVPSIYISSPLCFPCLIIHQTFSLRMSVLFFILSSVCLLYCKSLSFLFSVFLSSYLTISLSSLYIYLSLFLDPPSMLMTSQVIYHHPSSLESPAASPSTCPLSSSVTTV